MTPTTWRLLDQAHQALRGAADAIDESQWAAPTPCAEWNVAQVLRHALGDQRAYAAALTGSGGPDENPFDPAPERPAQVTDVVASALATSAAAFAGVTPGDRVPTPLPQGEMTADMAVGAASLDAAIHAWDIAIATGHPSPLSPALARELLPVAAKIVEPLRGFAYAAALPAQAGDDDTARLLRYLGRDPRPAGSEG